MENKEFYEICITMLVEQKPDRITEEEVIEYLNGDGIKTTTMKDVLERLCITLQNYQGMKNYIGYFTRNKDAIKRTLFDFDIMRSYVAYPKTETLYNAFITNGCDMKKSQNSWIKYCKAIINGLKWLKQFRDFHSFDRFIKSYDKLEFELIYMLSNLDQKFVGFALACDLIKELGYKNYSKPDIHIEQILNAKKCSELNVSPKHKLVNQHITFLELKAIAEDCNVSDYHLDKLLWTLSSGHFHGPINHKFKPLKKELLEMLTSV